MWTSLAPLCSDPLRKLLPFLFPLSVLLIGGWRLSVSSDSTRPALNQVAVPNELGALPDYSAAPPGDRITCKQNPKLDQALLLEGQRLGIRVVAGQPELVGKDATYRAEHGRLGTITLKQRPMSAEVRCMLISHEFIHVLQHLSADLKGVPPLGWDVSPQGIQRFGSIQEAEAYRHQNHAGHVLQLLRATPVP
ncbi:hypothetical protein [Synechococcus sp. UW179B]|uniref:hypothetical protein n=1 Tax=Synechococcus sp. UW179B TaxID=2575516 RepID=UPI001FCA8698|nr:hypothetical protein [Synechococcus sp. UW179B]